MIIYLVISDRIRLQTILKNKYPNTLMSYYYLKKSCGFTLDDFPEGQNILLDSGAFTADAMNKEISIPEYAEFIKKYQHKITHCVNLDVIGDKTKNQDSAKLSYINLKKLEALGVNPIPVFHQKEDLKVLDWYAKNYEYIGLGGVGNLGNFNLRVAWLNKIFTRYPNTKFHGFAITDFKVLMRFPFYSVDSTSWLMGSRFGTINLYIDENNIFMIKPDDYYKLKRNGQYKEIEKYLPEGLKFEDLFDSIIINDEVIEKKNYQNRDLVNLMTFVKIGEHVNKNINKITEENSKIKINSLF